MCLELMREMMRDVRICCFIEGCNEFVFFFCAFLCFFTFYIGRDIDYFVFIFFNKFFYYSCTFFFF